MGRVKKQVPCLKKIKLFVMLIFKDSYFKPWEQLKDKSYGAQGELSHENSLCLV
jgi:hypothetical protein